MRPNSVSLAISMASASVLYVSIDRTGPKISSFAIRISRVTLANTVGFTKFPPSSPSGWPSPPMTSSAPSSIPDLIDSCTRLYCFVLANGPRVTSLSLGSPILVFFAARRCQSLHFVEWVFRHAQPRSRNAGLPVIQVAGVDGHRDRRGEIGVVQNDVRRLAAEFQRQALHRVQGVLRDQFSDLRRTGERDLLNVGTFRQLRPDDLTEAGHEIDNARRQTGFMKCVHQHFRLHRALLAGLDDNSASGSDCRSHLDRDRTGARIPRRKYAHHARRFHDDFGSPDSSCQIEVLENFFEVQENVSREVVRALRAVLRSAVFQNRRV